MSPTPMDTIANAITQLAAHLRPVDIEAIPVASAAGRVLADPLTADRDSPALSVSAMDGYAVCLEDLPDDLTTALRVAHVAAAGAPPVQLPTGEAVMIFTGAPVPHGANCVIKREDTLEREGAVTLQLAKEDLAQGQHIRWRGENIQQGAELLAAGTILGPAAVAATASFGACELQVRRRLRVTVLNTGDELVPAGQPVEDWQIRDSNGPVLDAWLSSLPWVEPVARRRVGDTLEAVQAVLAEAISSSDAVILTGGVSMGNADYVPEAIQRLGGTIGFHRLPLRPGKPVLGASLANRLILGLPGNPVSVAVTARVFGDPLLRCLAGAARREAFPCVYLEDADDQHLPLVWYRLVTIHADGRARLCSSRGSGDLVSLARSHGFIEIPAASSGVGPWPYTHW